MKEGKGMKKAVLLVVLVLCVSIGAGATVELVFTADNLTDLPALYWEDMYNLLDWVGDDFDGNWDSLRVYDANGNELPYQFLDIDGSGRLSALDTLIFTFDDWAKVVISEDWSIKPPEYASVFVLDESEDSLIVSLKDQPIVIEIDRYGMPTYIKHGEVEGRLFSELGIARVAGWVGSTWWADGAMGRHDEKVTPHFRVVDQYVTGNGPVALGVMTVLESPDFIGLQQILDVIILHTGEILVQNEFVFKGYVDLMKLQVQATHPLTDMDRETLWHVIPMFRKMLWSDQLSITPWEYWKERGAAKIVDQDPYIVFPANDSMKPLWWGATYIFTSEESWRANYSDTLKLAAVELDPIMRPVVFSNLEQFMFGNTWVYESNEFRSGIFRWFPGELEASFIGLPNDLNETYRFIPGIKNPFATTQGAVTSVMEEMPARYIPGDVVYVPKVYGLYSFESVEELIRFAHLRSIEIQSSDFAQ